MEAQTKSKSVLPFLEAVCKAYGKCALTSEQIAPFLDRTPYSIGKSIRKYVKQGILRREFIKVNGVKQRVVYWVGKPEEKTEDKD